MNCIMLGVPHITFNEDAKVEFSSGGFGGEIM